MENNDFISKKCKPCEGGVLPLEKGVVDSYLREVEGWEVSTDYKSIFKKYKFVDFKETMEFVKKVAEIAESEDHHPDMVISYSKLDINLSTHAISGLSENDFILAAKINNK